MYQVYILNKCKFITLNKEPSPKIFEAQVILFTLLKYIYLNSTACNVITCISHIPLVNIYYWEVIKTTTILNHDCPICSYFLFCTEHVLVFEN